MMRCTENHALHLEMKRSLMKLISFDIYTAVEFSCIMHIIDIALFLFLSVWHGTKEVVVEEKGDRISTKRFTGLVHFQSGARYVRVNLALLFRILILIVC